MTKICPSCQKEYSDDHGFCSQCGSKLVPKQETPPSTLHLGDANAISGGISINQSKNITSHDVHYHTTQERSKTDKEIQQEQQRQYFEAVKQRTQNGIILWDDRAELESLRLSLGIDPVTAKKIEDAVINELKAKAQVANADLSLLAKMALKNAVAAIEQNSPQAKSHLSKLAAVCKNTINEEAHFYYTLLMAAFEPQQCVEAYERRTTDSYWLAFWSSLAYRKLGKEYESEAILNEMSILYADRPETNLLLNACVGMWLSSQGNPGSCLKEIEEYLNQCEQEPSALLNDLFHALLHRVGMEESTDSHIAFYEEQFLKEGSKCSPECEAEMKEAQTAYNHADFEAALRIWRKWAANDDTEAMRMIASCYDQGIGVEKDEQMTLEWYRKASELGDVEAMYKTGLCYQFDSGVSEEALKWYEKAAALGHANSMFRIGSLYRDGDGVEENRDTMLQWFVKAFKAAVQEGLYGDSDFCYDVDLAYLEEECDEKEFQELVEWCQNAAASGNTAAMMHLAYLAEPCLDDDDDEDDQVVVDLAEKREAYKEALQRYRKAADLGNADAVWELVKIYGNGDWWYGCYENLQEALHWCRKATEMGNTLAMRVMGDYCMEGKLLVDRDFKELNRNMNATEHGFGSERKSLKSPQSSDFKEAVGWYRKATDLGDVDAMMDLGETYYDAYNYTGLPQHFDECVKWYERAAAFHDTGGTIRYYCLTHGVPINLYYTFYGAEHGNPEKQNELGILYYKGDKGLPQDNNEAFKWFREGALQGDALSQRNLGLMYEQGRGVPQSFYEARKWYQKALDNGYATAKDDLERIRNKS